MSTIVVKEDAETHLGPAEHWVLHPEAACSPSALLFEAFLFESEGRTEASHHR